MPDPRNVSQKHPLAKLQRNRKYAYWNYRVLKRTHLMPDGTEDTYEIIEVYYAKDDAILAWSDDGIRPHGGSVNELYDCVQRMAMAVALAHVQRNDKRRPLTLADLPGGHKE